jgi:hypothetical protein
MPDYWLEASLHPEGPVTDQLNQGFPWFSLVPEQTLSWYPNPRCTACFTCSPPNGNISTFRSNTAPLKPRGLGTKTYWFTDRRSYIDCLPCQDDFFVNNPPTSKKIVTLLFTCFANFRSWWVWIFPLGGLLLCLRINTVNSALVISDDRGKEGCIIGGFLTKLLADIDKLLLIGWIVKTPSGKIHDSK